MIKPLRIIQVLLVLTYILLYFFPEWFVFDSQGWAHYLMAFLFGTFIITGWYDYQNRKKRQK
ncbi:hypothetical protein [Roseivirga misakiensis]|uniref:hypothetical protein n=1 Tax=Roseivirga misakiensis TaxID=1563681 RepID=UPI00159F1419|nr:hypothetical protein [Roseivirga misakiensis]